MRHGYHLARRRKGLVCHYGLIAVRPGRPTTSWELLPDGYRVSDFDGFAKGRRVTLLDWRPLSEGKDIEARLESCRTRHPRWSLFGHNCEHAARWALTGRRESRQVSACRTAAMVAGALLLGVARLVVRR